MISLLLNLGDSIKNAILGVLVFIPKLIYFLISCVFSAIDLFQISFRKLAGLDNIWISGEVVKGDTVYNIILKSIFGGEYPAFRTAFWALIILGVFMLIVASIIQVIRLEYNPTNDKGNSKSQVIKNFLKALFSFAIVPVVCFFGMYLANSLIGIVDLATSAPVTTTEAITTNFKPWTDVSTGVNSSETRTSYIAYEVFGVQIPTTSQTFSGMIFRASAYTANRTRNSSEFYQKVILQADDGDSTSNFGIFNKYSQAEAAELIDLAFAINANVGDSYDLNTKVTDPFFNDFIHVFSSNKNITHFSRFNASLVFYYYDLWIFNYLVAIIAVLAIGRSYYSFVIYLMQRFFEIAGLFLISPIAVSLMAFDNGTALGKWRTEFVSRFVSVIVLVGTLNLVTPLLQICQDISLFKNPIIDYIILTFFMIAALNAVKALNATVSSIIGTSNAMDASNSAKDQFNGSLSQGVNKAKHIALDTGKFVHGGAQMIGAGVGAVANKFTRKSRVGEKVAEERGLTHSAKNAPAEYTAFNEREDSAQLAEDFINSGKEFDKFVDTYYGSLNRDQAIQDVRNGKIKNKHAQAEALNYFSNREAYMGATNFQKIEGSETLDAEASKGDIQVYRDSDGNIRKYNTKNKTSEYFDAQNNAIKQDRYMQDHYSNGTENISKNEFDKRLYTFTHSNSNKADVLLSKADLEKAKQAQKEQDNARAKAKLKQGSTNAVKGINGIADETTDMVIGSKPPRKHK